MMFLQNISMNASGGLPSRCSGVLMTCKRIATNDSLLARGGNQTLFLVGITSADFDYGVHRPVSKGGTLHQILQNLLKVASMLVLGKW